MSSPGGAAASCEGSMACGTCDGHAHRGRAQKPATILVDCLVRPARIHSCHGFLLHYHLQMFSTVRSNGAAQWVRSTQFLVRSPLKGQNGAADRQLGANGGPLSIALAESGHNA